MNKKISILIVDDEMDLLEMYQELFELEGFQVYVASSGERGLELFKEHQDIDLIISDSNMGAMTGIDFLKNLLSLKQNIPKFYLSTGALEFTENDIIKLGGSGLVLKPFDLDDVLIKIKNDLKL